MNGKMKFLLITLISIVIPYQAFGYVQMTNVGGVNKDHYISDVLLRDLVDRMGKDLLLDNDDIYIDTLPNIPSHLSLMSSRASSSGGKDLDIGGEQLDYDTLLDGSNTNPSLRDQEYMQHSSLWGHQYVSGGAGEGPHRIKPQIKTDASLPAYCNPPNPCPYGLTEDQGCIIDFENTAGFSRDYQSAQECMCDGEHMFDCPGQEQINNNNDDNRQMATDLENFLARQFHTGNVPEHKNLVAKKFHPSNNNMLIDNDDTSIILNEHLKNPFLQGDKLPIAAKKGINVY